MKTSIKSRLNRLNDTNIGGYFLCAACFLIFPLSIQDYSNITVWKTQTLFLILPTAVVLCIVSMIFTKKRPKGILKSPTLWFIAAYIAVCIISVLLSPYSKYQSLNKESVGLFGWGRTDGLFYILTYLLLLIIPALFCGLKKSFAYLLAVSGGINAVITVLQLFGLNVFGFIPFASFYYKFIEFAGTFGNIDFLSAFLCFSACFTAGYYMITDDGRQRHVLPIAFALIIYAELAIGVSSGLIGLLTAAVATLPLFISNSQKLQKAANLLIALLAGMLPCTVISHTYTDNETYDHISFGTSFFIVLALLILAVGARILLINIKPSYRQKPALIIMYSAEAVVIISALIIIKYAFIGAGGLLGELSSALNGTVSPMAGSHRIAIWQQSLKIFKNSPWFGVGVGSYARAFSSEVLSEYQQIIGKNTVPDAAHNEFLQQLVTVGVIGFVTYMGWLLSIIIRGFKYAIKNPKIAVCLCAAIGFAAQMFFSINIIITAPFFYIVLGMTEYEIRNTKHPDNIKKAENESEDINPVPNTDITI